MKTLYQLIAIVLFSSSAYAQTAQLCWTPADWPTGWTVEGYNMLVSDPSLEPFTSGTVDAGLPDLNGSGNHVYEMPIPTDPDSAAKLRFNVEAYGRDGTGKFVKSQPSNALDITCSEIGAVGGVNVCPAACMPADADCDGRVTASDALIVLRIALGIMPAPDCQP